jgi:hypothetical protein
MAQLSFPIQPDGLVVDAMVNLEAAALLALWSAGQSRPAIQARGLLDTGSNVSAVALSTLHQLGVPTIGQSSTTGIGGVVPVSLFRVSLHVWDQRHPRLPWLSQPSLLVMNLAPGFPADVLIGLDVLLTCVLRVDGPGGTFTLDF